MTEHHMGPRASTGRAWGAARVGKNKLGHICDAKEANVKLTSLLILALAVLAIPTWVGAESAAQVRTVDEIKKLEELRNQAVVHGDVAALDRMTADDYTFITLRGELRTKPEILKGFRSGSFHYESRGISDLKVRLYGDTAIVTGRSVQKGAENGKDYSGDYRFTRVYVRQGGVWLTVALQTTLIRP